jgi:hypothetical protein
MRQPNLSKKLLDAYPKRDGSRLFRPALSYLYLNREMVEIVFS